jgi:hypothetical protein
VASDRALFGMTDSDWATRHSTSGNVFVLNRAAVSWGSKKQKTVALSSCEAEIVAASEAGKDAVLTASCFALREDVHTGGAARNVVAPPRVTPELCAWVSPRVASVCVYASACAVRYTDTLLPSASRFLP